MFLHWWWYVICSTRLVHLLLLPSIYLYSIDYMTWWAQTNIYVIIMQNNTTYCSYSYWNPVPRISPLPPSPLISTIYAY